MSDKHQPLAGRRGTAAGRGVADPCDGMTDGDDQPLAAPGWNAGGCDEALADCDGPPWRRGSETQNKNKMAVKKNWPLLWNMEQTGREEKNISNANFSR